MSGYNHKVVNTGSQMLYNVEIECNGRSFGHGYVAEGGQSSYSGSFKLSKNDCVNVIWGLNEKNKYHKQVVIDKSTILKEVIFELDGKDVNVEYE